FERMATAFALPFVPVRRPEWDKFAGAYYSVALDIPVGEGRTLQIGSVHHYRENFSRPYGIQYEASDGTTKFVHQTTFGLSERLLGAVISVHGDAKGAVFPRELAPYEVVVIPILSAASGDTPRSAANEIVARLARAGFRVHLDDRDDRPGAKYYYWELRGAPLRLEVGAREAAARTASAVDRLGTRGSVALDSLEADVEGALVAFDRALLGRAQAEFARAFALVRSVEELRGAKHVAQLAWCGSEECGHAIEQAIDGALLGTPEGTPPIDAPLPEGCLVCGATTGVRWVLAARPL
ncbi:MAG: His/Gly/Thr/Pro-type tRNA ligase C-terminal domain-containing protein, partial [Thermoplasmata archaeon]